MIPESHTTHAMDQYATLTHCGRLPARLRNAVFVEPFWLVRITCAVCHHIAKQRRAAK